MLVDCTGSVHGNYDRFHNYTDQKHVDTKTHGYTHSTSKRNKTLVCICHTQCNTLHESTVHNPYIKCINKKIRLHPSNTLCFFHIMPLLTTPKNDQLHC